MFLLPLTVFIHQAPEAQVRITLQTYVKAKEAFDVAGLESLLTSDYRDITPAGRVDDRAKAIGYFKLPAAERGPTPSEIKMDEVTVRFLTADVAVATFRETAEISVRPQNVTVQFRLGAVLKKSGKLWQLVQTQTTAVRD